ESPNPFTQQASQLVSEMMNRAGSPGFVTLDVQNKSSLNAADVTLARKAIETQLRAANVRLVKPERAVAELTVTISENVHGLLWITQIKQGPTAQTLMWQGDKPASSAVAHVPMLTVRNTPVFKQPDGTGRVVD